MIQKVPEVLGYYRILLTNYIEYTFMSSRKKAVAALSRDRFNIHPNPGVEKQEKNNADIPDGCIPLLNCCFFSFGFSKHSNERKEQYY